MKLICAFLVMVEAMLLNASEDVRSISSIFEGLGFSPVCVASALASCEISSHKDFIKNISCQLSSQADLHKSMALIASSLQDLKPRKNLPRNCYEIRQSGDAMSGVRTIYPLYHSENHSIEVYCDQSTDGGGWTVIQRRDALPIREDFYRNWTEFVVGFGNLRGEFWLGLDNIHILTSSTPMEIRFDLEDYKSVQRYAKYRKFIVGDSASKYRLTIDDYSGDVGNVMKYQNGFQFSTYDVDSDTDPRNCAELRRGAWWHKGGCWDANLNGYQHVGQHETWGDGINWNQFHNYHYSLKQTSMKIRPVTL